MAVLLPLTFPQWYGDQANLLNSTLSAIANSPISSRKITSSSSFNASNNGRSKGVGKIRIRSLDSWIHVRGFGVRNKPAFGSCNLPWQEGFTRQLWHPGTRIAPWSVKLFIVKSPFADVKRYVESNKYNRACGCWGSATTSWAHNFLSSLATSLSIILCELWTIRQKNAGWSCNKLAFAGLNVNSNRRKMENYSKFGKKQP